MHDSAQFTATQIELAISKFNELIHRKPSAIAPEGSGGKGVRIKVGEGEAKTVEVPLIPRSDIAALLTRLEID
jgi:hypothetical protein